MRISARTKDQGKYRSTHLEVLMNWVGDRRVFIIRDGNTGIQYQLRPHQALKLAEQLTRAVSSRSGDAERALERTETAT